jgi:3-oxoacyl-[acyl-carrier protein] reductase
LIDSSVIAITGTSKGIGRWLADYYASQGHQVVGCSRNPSEFKSDNYHHICLDITDEKAVKKFYHYIKKNYARLDILINNAGIASMNHVLLTTLETVESIYKTNVFGLFLFAREAAKIMRINHYGRIVHFGSIATPLKIEGESIYASSKAAIISLTQVMAKELSDFGITVNAIGPTPIETNLIKNIPKEKINNILEMQSIKRMATYDDIANVVDFFISSSSSFVTGQTLYLGGV